ncbi:RHS repeat-associated core domain-containing protein [Nonomuraea sp. NPDC049152]|uniref:RHS repeat-associated core domain-containing protein n=1 Tax=Nonomuraea sp. NPDC049152 TaxID=3154350 RepID=UPI0033CAE3EB
MSELTGYQGPVTTPQQMTGTSGVLPSLVDASITREAGDAAEPERRKRTPGALALESRSATPMKALNRQASSEPTERVNRMMQAGTTFPMIDDVYPEHGMLGTVTPLLTVRATRMGGGSSAQLEFFYTICEKPDEDEGSTPAPECVTSGGLVGEETWRVPAGKLEWGKQYEWWVHVVDVESGETDDSDKLLVTTGARQPLTSAHLGERGGDGQEFSPIAGNYTTTAVDAQVTVAGPPLSVVRTYNSADARTNGIFGAGWSTPWDMKITAEGTTASVTDLLVTYPSGRRVRFANKGNGTYQPPPGMHDVLADVAGGGWRLMDKASTSYHFDAAGRLLKITDRRGRAQSLHYGSDGKISKVFAVGGRGLHLTWQGDRVATVSTDPVDGKGLTWTYTYTGDNLTSVCAPVAAPNCTNYAYEDGSRYRTVVLDAEPVHYFRFGPEPTGNPINEGSSGRTGYYRDITPGQPGALEGSTHTAAGFTKSKMALPSDAISRLRERLSIEGWFKTTQQGMIFSAGQFDYAFGATQPVLYIGTDGRLRGQLGNIKNSSGNWVYTPITSAAAVTDNQWHHVVLNVADGRQKLFLDGQAVGEVSGEIYPDYRAEASVGSGDRGSSWASIPAGPNITGAFSFKGSIDEFAIYDKPLTDTEVQTHYAARAKVANKLVKMTLPSGRVWAANSYDTATDRLKTHTDRHGGTWQIGKPDTDWLEKVDIVTVTDPRNDTLTYGYDKWRGSRLVYQKDQREFQTRYEYDTGGFQAKVTDRNGNVFRRYNDERGNPIRSESCRTAGSCQSTYATYYLNKDDEFDPRNDSVLIYRDARSSDSGSNTYATTYEYNQFGEQTKETTPATTDFPSGRSTVATYTDGSEAAVGGGTAPAGLVASRRDARGNTWTYRYTAAGDLAEQTDPVGLVTKLNYDALGRLIDSTQVSQAHPDGVKTTFTYDELSRPATQTEPGVKNETTNVTHTKRTKLAYDADGNRLSEKISDLTGGDAERATVYTYDALGRVETVTGPEGGVVRQSWNTLGQLVRVTDARGAVVEHSYGERGELTSRTLKGWTGSPVNPTPAKDVVLESFFYDAGGRLATQVDAMGRKTSYTYFGDNLVAKKIADDVKLNGSTTPRDVVLEDHTYDAAGNRTKLVTGGDTATTEFVFDEAGRLTSQTFDPSVLNRKTAFTYDANGNLLKATLTGAGTARAEVTEYAYNKVNQVTKTTVENGDEDLVSTASYDDRGLITATTDPRGNVSGANEADFTSTMRYDLLGRPVEVTGPQVKVDKAGTSSTARPSVHLGYDTFGATTQETDAEGRTITSVFDKAGRLTSKSAPSYTPPGGTAVTPTTTNSYDPAGQLIGTTDPRGYATTFEYDQLGRQVRVTDPAPQGQSPGRWVTEYDLAGEQLASVDPTGARVEATYDDLGRAITSTTVERKPTSAAYTTTLTYNDAGHLTKTVAPGNRATNFKVNAAGEMTEKKDPATHTTTMTYDPAGRPLKVTDPLRNVTVAEYDLAGRQIATKDLNASGTVMRTASTGYDPAGNPTSSTSPEGHVTKQTFDALNRATSLIEPVSAAKSITTSFGYDASSARTRLTDGRGNATWTSYNSLGLPESVTEPATTAHPNLADRTWTSSYDTAGNQVSLIQPGGVRIDRTFDHLGRLTKETGTGAETVTSDSTFGYDLAGRQTSFGNQSVEFNDRGLITKITEGSVQRTAYSYNELGNPSQRVDAAGTANFTWDNVGRLATGSDPVAGRTLTYGYDDADRLTSITPTSGQAGTQTYTYDDLDRVETHTLKNGTGAQLSKITYGWDEDDNLTSKVTAGLAGTGSNTYGYDHAGRLTSWTAPGGTTTSYEWDDSGNRSKAGDKTFTYDERNRLTTGDGTDYTYTARGTLATETKAGTTRNLTFNAFDQLVNDGELAYTYDALGRLTSRAKAGATQHYAYSGLANDIAAITDNAGAVQAKYGRDLSGGALSVQEGGGVAVSALADLHGDLVATFNANALVDSTAYDPFGQITAQTGTKRNLGYQGEYTDPDTGKVNMYARWYQPGTGGFASRDIATLAPYPSVQANRYTYGNASPLTGTDPTGHSTVLVNPSPMGWGGDAIVPGSSLHEAGWASGGCVGGMGGGSICHETASHQQWWSEFTSAPGYDWLYGPGLSNEEIERWGGKYMRNGRPVDQPYFWADSVPEKTRDGYMAAWSPVAKDSTLMNNWTMAGGLTATHGLYGGGLSPSIRKAPEFKYYDTYSKLIRYYKTIRKAASNHGVSEESLTAVLLWEINTTANKYGGISLTADFYLGIYSDRKTKNKGVGASIGLAQLEIYKVRMMMMKHYGKEEWKRRPIADYVKQGLDPNRSIHLAAAWMAHLKENVWYMKDGAKHYLDDKEAAIAYCGCSGVTVDNPASGNTQLNFDRFRTWAENGFRDEFLTVRDPKSRATGIQRRHQILEWLQDGNAVDEYWECIRIGSARCD